MSTPTDLRAALRDAANALARIGLRRDAELIASLRALADAPPTVAELLPRADATHAVEWTATTGERMRIRLDDGGRAPIFRVECWGAVSKVWRAAILGPDDMNCPARLVEVSP